MHAVQAAGPAERTAPHEGAHGFELPRLKALIWHGLPRFVEGAIAPVAVFYAAFAIFGLTGALIAAVTWVYGGIAWRLVRRQPVPGVLLLAAVGVTVRAALSAATGSAVVYFLQPTLGTVIVSISFLASVPLQRPLAKKLAADMVPFPEGFLRHERVHQFFLRISLLWAFVFALNASISLWMLFHESISTYLWVRTSLVTGLGAAAIAISVVAFRRLLKHVNGEHAIGEQAA